MYFHALLIFSENEQKFISNKTKDYTIEKVIIPFTNGQVINGSAGIIGQSFINMKTVQTIAIYKTDEKLVATKETTILDILKSKEFQVNNCTKEIQLEVKDFNTRSDLQRKFSNEKDQFFVIMKFGDKVLDSAYHGVYKQVIEKEFGSKAYRVDEVQNSGKITDQIIEFISESKWIIADLSGERPNTYYEAGYAQALGKEIIFTIRKGESIHFDLSGHRFIIWETEFDLRKQLTDRIGSIFTRDMEHEKINS